MINQVGHTILTPRHIIFLVIFHLLPLVSFCQEIKNNNVEEKESIRFHDLKLDLFNTGRRSVTPVYEIVWSDKWGLEVGAMFNSRPRSIMEIDLPFTRFEFNSATIKPYISLKRYFPFPKNKQHAFYFGTHSQLSYLLYIEEGYLEKNEEILGRPLSESASQTRGIQILDLGIQSGFNTNLTP